MRILCVLGEWQYGIYSRGRGTEFNAFIPALKGLGHEVVHFESWDKTRYRDYSELNRVLLDTVDKVRPEVLLAVQMDYEIWRETLEILKARGDVATVCWTTDDSWKYGEVSRFIGRSYHGMVTTYPEVVPKYHRDGIPNVLLTQWAANGESLQEPLPSSACVYPVTFIGAAHGDRKRQVADLELRGVKVSCFGHGWPAGPVPAEEIPRIIRNSVISSNFANSKGANQIKARTFEVPGAGGFLLTEGAPGLDRYYTPGKEIVVFDGLGDFAEKAKYYLSHPQERDAIAKAGFDRTKREHTYDLRLKEVLDFALRAREEWVRKGPHPPPPTFEEACLRHRLNVVLRVLRVLLTAGGVVVWGLDRGPRAARRLVFELSWRWAGAKTFSSAGWPGRMFPKV